MFTITEHRGRTIDAWCKIIATAAIVVGGTWTAASYLINRSDTAKSASIEARKPVFEKQLETCLSAVKLANTAAGASTEAAQAQIDFEALFRSTITVVADQNVYVPASNFSDCLSNAACKGELAARAYNLALGCSKSVSERWGTTLHSPAPSPVTNVKVTAQ
jgi:hypothetical protein